MIAVASLWTNTPRFKMPRTLAMIYSAAAAHMTRHFGQSELVTDDRGLEIADRLRWNYTSFSKALNNTGKAENKHVWMLGKLDASSIQSKSHAHIDLDLIVLGAPPERLTKATCLVQSKDLQEIYRSEKIAGMMQIAGIPDHIVPYNTGIIGWNNLEMRDIYVRGARQIADKLSHFFPNEREGTAISVVAEQAYLAYLMREHKQPVTECIPLFSNVTAADFRDFPFSHFWSEAKSNVWATTKLEARFSRDFPEAYENFERGWEFLKSKQLT